MLFKEEDVFNFIYYYLLLLLKWQENSLNLNYLQMKCLK